VYRDNLRADNLNPEQAGRAVGEALHYLQDSWAAGHVTRNAEGKITRFQDYSKQSPGHHADEDVVRMWDKKDLDLVQRSIDLMKVADGNLKGDALKNHIRDTFYPLEPGAKSGGSEDYFKKKEEKKE
jgi:hypothetical protein